MRVIVVGGGVVGCHVALHFAGRKNEVFLLEKNPRLGQETSTRNSGVLHAGIYYRRDSLKARLCVEGNARSREFFARHDVPFRPTGKYIISKGGREDEDLEKLFQNALANGVPGMERVLPEEVTREAPFIRCSSALFSSSTGILDASEYLTILKGLLYQADVTVLCGCRALGVDSGGVETDRGYIEGDVMINAAGLYADDLASGSGLEDYRVIPLKGDYYCTLTFPLEVPIYPLPNRELNTLGIHFTPTFGREVLIGPSEHSSRGKGDYSVETPREVFERELRDVLTLASYEAIEIHEGFSGNRPRAYKGEERCDDFVIIRKPDNVIHLLGIESPGLTAAPAMAAHLAALL